MEADPAFFESHKLSLKIPKSQTMYSHYTTSEPELKIIRLLKKKKTFFFNDVFQDPAPYVDEVLKISIPEDLTAQFDKPDKLEVIVSWSIMIQSRAGLNPAYLPERQGTLCMYRTTQEGSTTQILWPRKIF